MDRKESTSGAESVSVILNLFVLSCVSTVGLSRRECIILHISAVVREKQCSVAVTLIFSLSNYQGSFACSPPHHHLVLFHSSPMDYTQHDSQLLWWSDTMSLRQLMNDQEPTKLYKVGDKAEWLD